ncbi:MAG: TIGR01777 family oxidoreductase [Bacteroidetes bacterium]|nr:TIGR01777 family oxidoreductase [Bacteroidota bacterium]MDA0943028.1 TIGR01777 family oxidoreductase [Bacteroidota bacterium]MDA1111600.1 TIGR01777 family oxidoreductase [Bacteroidota bacterium]
MIITITGSSGLIGSRLQQRLLQRGHSLRFLSFRRVNNQSDKKDFIWNPENQKIDIEALQGADAVIHLAGSSIAQRWTAKTKIRIHRSRSIGSQLLADSLKEINSQARVVSASGIGYYPDPSQETLDEDHSPGQGFFAQVCQDWEAPFIPSLKSGHPICILRTGLVLSNRGGLLPLVQSTAPWGFVPMTGSTHNTWSWIHIEDLVSLYIAAVEGELAPGIYNAVAPKPCSQGTFAQELLNLKSKAPWKWKPNIPVFALKALLGEQSCLALTNQTVSADRLKKALFSFEFPQIKQALHHLHTHHEL